MMGTFYLPFAAGATLLLKPTIHDEDGWAFGAVDSDDKRLRAWGWLPRCFFKAYNSERESPTEDGGTGTAHGNGTNSATVLMRVVTDISAR